MEVPGLNFSPAFCSVHVPIVPVVIPIAVPGALGDQSPMSGGEGLIDPGVR